MKHFLWNKYAKLSKFIVAGSFVAISCLSGTAAYASGGGGSLPTLKFFSVPSQFEANDCLYARLVGKHFSYAGPNAYTVTLSAGPNFDVMPILPPPTIPPVLPQVHVGHDGNFEQLVSICYNGDKATPVTQVNDFTVSATDSTTNTTATTDPVNISDPHPRIHSTSSTIWLSNGCATVPIVGDHFIKSGVVENYATLQFYKGTDTADYLLSQPLEVNVLGGGNIAIAASVCGLSKGDHFFAQATDEGSLFTTNPVALQAQ